MPDLKHNFSRGRMNKDLDERLVPDGEYRDAENIEIVSVLVILLTIKIILYIGLYQQQNHQIILPIQV